MRLTLLIGNAIDIALGFLTLVGVIGAIAQMLLEFF
jgi:hypothetical protein